MISSVGGTFWTVSSVGGTFWAVSRVGGTLLAVLRVGGTLWRYLELAVFFYGSGKTKTWRCFLVVTQDGGFFFTEAVKPKYGGVFWW